MPILALFNFVFSSYKNKIQKVKKFVKSYQKAEKNKTQSYNIKAYP